MALWVLDLEGMRQYRRRTAPGRRRVRDLARLMVALERFGRRHPHRTGPEVCRAFLAGYLGPSASQETQRNLCSRVKARSRRLATVRRKRGSAGEDLPPT